MTRKRTRDRLPRWSGVLAALLAIGIGGFSAPAVAVPHRSGTALLEPSGREASLVRIVSSLGARGMNRDVFEKTRIKLHTMSDGQLRIAAALADRIASDESAAVTETAYLLLTLLIVLA